MNQDKRVLLSGVVTSVSTVGYSSDKREHVTFSVDGAEHLWAEFRVPNNHGWTVGDKVAISVVHVGHRPMEAAGSVSHGAGQEQR